MAAAGSEQQLKALANLLLLQQRLREASTEAELGFLLVNDTRMLLPYRSGVCWLTRSAQAARGSVVSVSGAVDHDPYSPYVQWMKALCEELSAERGRGVRAVRKADVSDALADKWAEHGTGLLLWCPLHSAAGVFLGGLALWREEPLLESEQRILGNWLGAAGYSLGALRGRAFARDGFRWSRRRKQLAAAIALVLVALMFVPVRLSVLALSLIHISEPTRPTT